MVGKDAQEIHFFALEIHFAPSEDPPEILPGEGQAQLVSLALDRAEGEAMRQRYRFQRPAREFPL